MAFNGRNHPNAFFWGEIAQQLGKPELFKEYWTGGPKAPDAHRWERCAEVLSRRDIVKKLSEPW